MLYRVELVLTGALIFDGATHAYVISSFDRGPSPLKLYAEILNL